MKKSTILSLSSANSCNDTDFDELAPVEPAISIPYKDPEWAKNALAEIKEGNRNDTIFRIACRHLKLGIPPDEVAATMLPLARQVGLPDKEFDTLFKSALTYHPESTPQIAQEGPRNPLGWTLRKFLAYDLSEPDWICDPFISPGDIMFMTSDAGVGKTWLLLSLALAIATEQPWLGKFKTRQTPVLYCDFDNHKRGDAIRRRLIKLATALDFSPPYDTIPDTVTILTRHDLPNAFNLYKKDGLDTLKQDICKVGYGLVIVDTFISVHGAVSENDAAQMGMVLNNLRALIADTGAAFLISHHSRKPGANGEDSESRISYRGSTAIKGGADCMLELVAEKAGFIRCRHTKFRHVKQVKDWPISIKDTGNGGVNIECEDESNLAATKKDLAKGWLMADFWRTDSIPYQDGGFVAQSVLIERAQKADQGSLNIIKTALRELESMGRMESASAKNLGKTGVGIYWRKRKDGGIFEASDIPF